MSALQPSASVLAKIGSLIVHLDESLSPDGHHFDAAAIRALLADPEVRAWIDEMSALALVPMKRKP